jgi:hypothetical protein
MQQACIKLAKTSRTQGVEEAIGIWLMAAFLEKCSV